MYLLFAFAYFNIAYEIPPLVPFSNINNMSISVSNSNFTFVNFKHAFHDNPGADTK